MEDDFFRRRHVVHGPGQNRHRQHRPLGPGPRRQHPGQKLLLPGCQRHPPGGVHLARRLARRLAHKKGKVDVHVGLDLVVAGVAGGSRQLPLHLLQLGQNIGVHRPVQGVVA